MVDPPGFANVKILNESSGRWSSVGAFVLAHRKGDSCHTNRLSFGLCGQAEVGELHAILRRIVGQEEGIEAFDIDHGAGLWIEVESGVAADFTGIS